MEISPSREPKPQNRWPRWVYGDGEEPDYRFSFANERTFLAWIRTALALLAAAVALDVVDLSISDIFQRSLAAVLVLLGLVAVIAAWLRWAVAERAMRKSQALPSFGLSAPVAVVLAIVAIAVLIMTLTA